MKGQKNNGYLTEETLQYYNSLVRRVYNIRLSEIDILRIEENQTKLQRGWYDSKLSNESHINGVPIWRLKLLLEWLRNSHEDLMQGSLLEGANVGVDSSHIISLWAKGSMEVSHEATRHYTANSVYSIDVPEGYDGVDSFVEFYVPFDVIKNLSDRQAGLQTGGGSLYPRVYPHFLSEQDPDHLVYRGCYRPNALLFYQSFVQAPEEAGTSSGLLEIDVVKKKNVIRVKTSNNNFAPPFKEADMEEFSTLEPKVLVRISYFKRGVR